MTLIAGMLAYGVVMVLILAVMGGNSLSPLGDPETIDSCNKETLKRLLGPYTHLS